MKNLSDKTFEELVLKSKRPVLVQFTAAWCGPCKAMKPKLLTLEKEQAGKADVYLLDVEEAPETAQQYGIMSMPTFLTFKGGRVVGQLIGAVQKDKLDDFLQKVIDS